MTTASPSLPADAPQGRDAASDVAEHGLERVAQHLEQVATIAAHQVRDYLRGAFSDVQEVSLKKNFQDLVTKHDRETEQILGAAVLEAVPDSQVLGEEGGRLGDGAIEWIIDPIDGTSNFALGLPHFAVSIGAVLDGQMVAGVIFDPLRDLTYAASLLGATRNGEPLHSTGPTRDADAMLITSYPGPDLLRSDQGDQALALYSDLTQNFAALRRMGCTTLALCSVAEGSAAAAYGFGINPWDVAAGYLIVEQAGGTYRPLIKSDGQIGSEKEPWLAPGYLATVADYDLSSSTLQAFVAR